MDDLTEQLLRACEMVLYQCQKQDRVDPVVFYFEGGSEAHLMLLEAINQAHLTLGLVAQDKMPEIQPCLLTEMSEKVRWS